VVVVGVVGWWFRTRESPSSLLPQQRSVAVSRSSVNIDESVKKANSKKTIGVIGAGPCGLVSAKVLKDFGFNVIVFEQTEKIGGLWNYDPNPK
jgi:NADPH-dependent glutamate synthase beta subunit-like oxidoreductase